MTLSAHESVVIRPARQTRPMHPRAEALWFTGATAVWVLHGLDDAFLDRQPGVPIGQHLVAVLVTVALAALAIFAFPRARPGVRSLLALTFGVFALADGMLHVLHVAGQGPAASDLTGALAALAGVALLTLAACPTAIAANARAAAAAAGSTGWSPSSPAPPSCTSSSFPSRSRSSPRTSPARRSAPRPAPATDP